MSLGGLLVVTSVVVALSDGGIVVSAADENRKLLELSFSAGVLLLLLESWSFGSPETDAKTPRIYARRKVFML